MTGDLRRERFGLYRAAVAAGIGDAGDRPREDAQRAVRWVKTDRKDAELLARLLLAGR